MEMKSLGSSTVQLHDSLGIRRACACSSLVSAVKMATVLQNILLKGSILFAFFVGKRTQCKRYSQRNVSYLWQEMFVT
jgi:hypothetical protein